MARRLAAEGRPVALVARRADKLEALAAELGSGAQRGTKVAAYAHDVTDYDTAESLFATIEDELGPIDELHYVAGVMPDVAEDEFDTDKDRVQFEVNTVGCIAWCNAAARRFLPRQRGRIVGVSSVAGDRGRSGRPGYNASKAGMDTFLEGLRNRLWRHGVQVTTIRPGFVETPMTEGIPLRGAITADEAAKQILSARDKKRVVAYVPFKWRIIMTVIKFIPSVIFRRLKI